MNCNDLIQVPQKGYFTRHCMMTSQNGILKNISISPSVESNIIDQLIWWQKGEQVRDFLTHKFGIVFLQFSSVEEMLHKTEAMQNLIYAEMI
jgi:hypothetical protein